MTLYAKRDSSRVSSFFLFYFSQARSKRRAFTSYNAGDQEKSREQPWQKARYPNDFHPNPTGKRHPAQNLHDVGQRVLLPVPQPGSQRVFVCVRG